MNRRTFLKVAGMGSLSLAAGCTSKPEKNLYALVQAPDDMVTGRATWYASTCRECPAGCGVLSKNREGRVVKLEGHPLHPINKGKLCMRGQAALQGLYNPDRIKTPLLKHGGRWRTLSFSEGEAVLREKTEEASQKGPDRVRMLTEAVGESLMNLFTESLQQWRSGAPLVFEPYGYETLKAANEKVFGVNGLPSYRMEGADFLVSFGADFLETWLSPVEYAWKFKEMHGLNGGHKALFFSVSPYQSMTCANADLWISCRPDGEVFVALALLRSALRLGRGEGLAENIRSAIEQVASPYTKEKAAQISGISLKHYEKLEGHLMGSERPLVLGVGAGGSGLNALQANAAVNLLNLVLDPGLSLLDFSGRHRIEIATRRSEILAFFDTLREGPSYLLLLNNVNPVYALHGSGVKATMEKDAIFVVSFSNFMDETTALADLILPTALPLETWDEYAGKLNIDSTLQPTTGSLNGAPTIGDVFLRNRSAEKGRAEGFQKYLMADLIGRGRVKNELEWLKALQMGGIFETPPRESRGRTGMPSGSFAGFFENLKEPKESDPAFIATPSIRFFDGRGANRPWLCEVPDPVTQVAWHTPVLLHRDTLKAKKLEEGELIRIESKWGKLEAPVYETEGVRPGVLVMGMGQGHVQYGRYARGMGLNPALLLSPDLEPASGAPLFVVGPVSVRRTGRSVKLAQTAGSRIQHGRTIALTVNLESLNSVEHREKHGLSMKDFPFTLPLPEGYDRERDVYSAHEHKEYRWAMVVDLDKCIGCGACAVACYAENNLGVVGFKRILEQREMSWLMVQRYHDEEEMKRITFLPMLCQHCDNAPCESVCPVYAPHHSEEGLNNQIYNRCIGTRFCSQNCPYKVRRFNWFSWKWPEPFNLQLNPDVTVRSKGVMEKCSFCIQRIKEAHGIAKDEKRKIQDGEIQPACLQTCPTGVFTFGNLVDSQSRVRKMVEDKRAYQVLGYLNTKPAVIYLKKVVQEI